MSTERILAQLEQGTVPWQRPWSGGEVPRNLVSKKEYRGINVFLLGAAGYESPWWLSFNQARDLGGSVRKGEKGTPVIFWKWMESGKDSSDPEEAEDLGGRGRRAKPMLRYYTVFNLSQMVLPEKHLPPARPPLDFQSIEACERIGQEMPEAPVIQHVKARAYYSPLNDRINLPRPETFVSPEAYHSTLFHELVHSTGHEKRLNRPTLADLCPFGSTNYSKEELVAEMGATFLCAHAGIENRTIDNSASYIAGWLQRLRDDRRLVVLAAAQAQRAADFILGRKFEE